MLCVERSKTQDAEMRFERLSTPLCELICVVLLQRQRIIFRSPVLAPLAHPASPRLSYVRTLRALVSLNLDPPRSWFQIGLFPSELDPFPFTHAWHPPQSLAWPKQSQHNIDPDRDLCPASPLVAFSIQLDSHSFSNQLIRRITPLLFALFLASNPHCTALRIPHNLFRISLSVSDAQPSQIHV